MRGIVNPLGALLVRMGAHPHLLVLHGSAANNRKLWGVSGQRSSQ